MDISIKKILELNDEIGLGKYGKISSNRYKIALEYISDECGESKRVCEIGPGGVIVYVSKYSDADTSAIVSPRENHWNEIFEKYNIELSSWDLNSEIDNQSLYESFDCIIFLETLEHLNRWPEKVMDDIHKLLKPGGVMLLSTPNLVRISNRIRMMLGIRPINPFKYSESGEHHVREFTLEELLEFLPSNKWNITDTNYALPHSFGAKSFFKPILKIFKTLLGTIIFIKARKKSSLHD